MHQLIREWKESHLKYLDAELKNTKLVNSLLDDIIKEDIVSAMEGFEPGDEEYEEQLEYYTSIFVEFKIINYRDLKYLILVFKGEDEGTVIVYLIDEKDEFGGKKIKDADCCHVRTIDSIAREYEQLILEGEIEG